MNETAVSVVRVNAAQLQEASEIRTDDRRDVAVLRFATQARWVEHDTGRGVRGEIERRDDRRALRT